MQNKMEIPSKTFGWKVLQNRFLRERFHCSWKMEVTRKL
jgi:hypothetical protein